MRCTTSNNTRRTYPPAPERPGADERCPAVVVAPLHRHAPKLGHGTEQQVDRRLLHVVGRLIHHGLLW
jgi:hypothetical protein